jgi:hypothetical protein
MWTFERVRKNSFIKWVTSVLGVIVISALASVLGEVAFKPVLIRTSYALMSLSSLGIESVRTGIYERIATGATNRSGAATLYLLTILTVNLCLLLFTHYVERYGFFQTQQKRRDGLADEARPKSVEELTEESRRLLKTFRRLLYFWGLLVLLASGMALVNLSRVSYEYAAVIHFQQALTITSPYLTNADRAMIESKFAQIHSKSEYVAIMDVLAKAANEHGQQVPPFRPW